jgi:hypothetical protein
MICLTQQTTVPDVPTVLVWFSSSAHPEKMKRITRQRKACANDVGLALSFAASDTDVALHFLEERKYLRIDPAC